MTGIDGGEIRFIGKELVEPYQSLNCHERKSTTVLVQYFGRKFHPSVLNRSLTFCRFCLDYLTRCPCCTTPQVPVQAGLSLDGLSRLTS